MYMHDISYLFAYIHRIRHIIIMIYHWLSRGDLDHADVRTRVAHMCVCVCGCVSVSVRVCVYICRSYRVYYNTHVYMCIHICIHTYIHIYIPIGILSYVCYYLPTDMMYRY